MPAFQPNAFQNDAFQTTEVVVAGFSPSRSRTPALAIRMLLTRRARRAPVLVDAPSVQPAHHRAPTLIPRARPRRAQLVLPEQPVSRQARPSRPRAVARPRAKTQAVVGQPPISPTVRRARPFASRPRSAHVQFIPDQVVVPPPPASFLPDVHRRTRLHVRVLRRTSPRVLDAASLAPAIRSPRAVRRYLVVRRSGRGTQVIRTIVVVVVVSPGKAYATVVAVTVATPDVFPSVS